MKEKLKKERNSNMKKIIFSFMMVGATILNANDLELVGKNVLKNSDAVSWCIFDVVREYTSNETPNSSNDFLMMP